MGGNPTVSAAPRTFFRPCWGERAGKRSRSRNGGARPLKLARTFGIAAARRSGGAGGAPARSPSLRKKEMVLYLCFWTLGLLLLLLLLLTSSIQTRRIAALTSGELARLAGMPGATGFESSRCTAGDSAFCWRRTCSAMLPGARAERAPLRHHGRVPLVPGDRQAAGVLLRVARGAEWSHRPRAAARRVCPRRLSALALALDLRR